MFKKFLLFSMLLLCLSRPCFSQITASQLYNSTITGPWIFENNRGQILTITVESTPFCVIGVCDGKFIRWHYVKNSCASYWNPTICAIINSTVVNDELWLTLHHDLPSDGYPFEQWRVTGFRCVCNGVQKTIMILPRTLGSSLPYVLIPSSTSLDPRTHSVSANALYTAFCTLGFTDDALDMSGPGCWSANWNTYSWQTVISYKGQNIVAVAVEQCEGGSSPGVCDLVHEILYLAPGIGPVAIWPIVGLDSNGNRLVLSVDDVMYRTN